MSALKPVALVKPVPLSAWYLTLSLAFIHLTSSMDRHVVGLILTPLKVEFDLSDTALGLLHGTAYTVLYAIAILPAGVLVDRVNRQAMVGVAALLWSLGTAAFAMADSFAMLVAARLIVGLGQAALIPAALSLIADAFDPRQLGRPIGVFTSASALGRGAVLIGGGAVLTWFGASATSAGTDPWRVLLLLTLIVNAGAILMLLTAKSPPRRMAALCGTGTARAEVLGHLRLNLRTYAALFIGAGMTVLLIQTITAWSPTLLVRRFDYSVPQSGFAFGVVVLLTAPLGNILGGWLLDKVRSAETLGDEQLTGPVGTLHTVVAHRRMIALALIGIVLVAPLFCVVSSAVVALVGLALASVLLGIATPIGLAGIQRIAPAELRGRITATYVAGVTLVSLGLGPVSVGWASTSLFSGDERLSYALLSVVILSAVTGAAVVYPRKGPLRQEGAL